MYKFPLPASILFSAAFLLAVHDLSAAPLSSYESDVPVFGTGFATSAADRALLARLDERRVLGDPAPAVPVACFAPGFPENDMAEYQKALWGNLKFEHVDTLQSTATNPMIVLPGPFTITYSFVPDGGPLVAGVGEPNTPSRLFELMEADCGYTRSQWQGLVAQVFHRWQELSGITYVYEPNDDGAPFVSSAGILGVRGDVRIGAHVIDEAACVLAYNYSPGGGSDMVLNAAAVRSFSDTRNNSRSLRNVISHEHGHGLGFGHSCPSIGKKLLEPVVPKTIDGPQEDDIRGVQAVYGDAYENNGSALKAHPVGVLVSQRTVDNASIRDSHDDDWYTFTLERAGTLTLTLTPVGAAYNAGPQNSDGTCSAGVPIDSLRNADLSLALTGPDGATLLGLANTAASGEPEVVTGVSLAPGAYRAHVIPGTSDLTQRYSLAMNFTPAVMAPADLSVSTTDTAETISPGTSLTYVTTATNHGERVEGVRVRDSAPVQLQDVAWTATYSAGIVGPSSGNGDIDVLLATFPASGVVQFTITGTVAPRIGSCTLRNQASILLPEYTSELTPSDNTAEDQTIVKSAFPNDVEEFNSFSDIAGSVVRVPSDVGPELRSWGFVTGSGYLVDRTYSQNGKGLTFSGTESKILAYASDLPGDGGYDGDKHMLAFWFRFEAAAQENDTWTTVISAICVGGSDIVYGIQVGKDVSGEPRLRVQAPSVEAPPGSTGGHFTVRNLASLQSVSPRVWHSCILQLSAAGEYVVDRSKPGTLRIWLDATDASASPSLDWDRDYVTAPPNQTRIFSINGGGALGRTVFGPQVNHYFAGKPGGQVWIDSVGTWNGFGTAGDDDLQAGIDFLRRAAAEPPPTPTPTPSPTPTPVPTAIPDTHNLWLLY